MPADFPKTEHRVLKLTQDAYDALVSFAKENPQQYLDEEDEFPRCAQ